MMNNCIRTNLFSAFDCIWLLEQLPQVSAQCEHTIASIINNLYTYLKLFDCTLLLRRFLSGATKANNWRLTHV